MKINEISFQRALRAELVRTGGVIVWEDYGSYWPEVKQILDGLADHVKLYSLCRDGLVVYIAGGKQCK
jgi:hypothetical protein